MIVIESIKAYPLRQLEAALSASARQLVKVATGEGVVDDIWHTSGMIENFVPSALQTTRAARQHKGELDFKAINKLHVPVALGSMVLLVLLLTIGMLVRIPAEPSGTLRSFPRKRESSLFSLGLRLRGDERSASAWRAQVANLMPLAITVALAILGNAVFCGVFANPHDRYGARIAWLATFVVVLVPWRLGRSREDRLRK